MSYNNYYTDLDKDQEGYLINYIDWNENIAIEIAKQENIILCEEHWYIIKYLRNFYCQFNIAPSTSMLIRTLSKLSKKKANSRYLFRLFPKGPAKQATKIAGLPKPIICL